MRQRAAGQASVSRRSTWPLVSLTADAEQTGYRGTAAQCLGLEEQNTYQPTPVGTQPASVTPDRARAKRKCADSSWRRRRQQWARIVAAGGVRCWRCGQPIHVGQRWELGHRTDAALGGSDQDTAPEHRACNREAGGWRTAAKVRRQPSRDW